MHLYKQDAFGYIHEPGQQQGNKKRTLNPASPSTSSPSGTPMQQSSRIQLSSCANLIRAQQMSTQIIYQTQTPQQPHRSSGQSQSPVIHPSNPNPATANPTPTSIRMLPGTQSRTSGFQSQSAVLLASDPQPATPEASCSSNRNLMPTQSSLSSSSFQSQSPVLLHSESSHALLRSSLNREPDEGDKLEAYVKRARRVLGRCCVPCISVELIHIVHDGELCQNARNVKCWGCWGRHYKKDCAFELIWYGRENANPAFCKKCGVLNDLHGSLPNNFCTEKMGKAGKGFVALMRMRNSTKFQQLTRVQSLNKEWLENEALTPSRECGSYQTWVEWLMKLTNEPYEGVAFIEVMSQVY
jgi:hypothetical protein